MRKGMDMVFRVLIVAVVLLIVAVIILSGFRGNQADFDNIIDGWLHSEEIRACETNVAMYCMQEPGGEWGPRYPHCQQFADAFDRDQDTSCPV